MLLGKQDVGFNMGIAAAQDAVRKHMNTAAVSGPAAALIAGIMNHTAEAILADLDRLKR